MAVEVPGLQLSFQAAADLSAYQYRFVKLDANGQAALCSAATDIPLGILQDKPAAAGRACNVMLDGRSKIVAGANLAKSDRVGTDSTGRAVALIAGTDTTKYPVGLVVNDNSIANGLADIIFDCKSPHRGT